MAQVRTIDVHAHILLEDTMRRMSKEAPDIGPKLSDIEAEHARFTVDGLVQHPFPRGAWDLEMRLRHMDAAEVDMQVLSNVPQTFLYNCDASLGATLSAIQNEAIAVVEEGLRHVGKHLNVDLGFIHVPESMLEIPGAARKRVLHEPVDGEAGVLRLNVAELRPDIGGFLRHAAHGVFEEDVRMHVDGADLSH